MQKSNTNFIKTTKPIYHHFDFHNQGDYAYYQEHANKKHKNRIKSERKKKTDRIHSS